VRLRVGRVPLHGIAVHTAQISPALVRRGAEGRARDAVLVGRLNRFRGAVPDAPEWHRQPEPTGARQEAGLYVTGEGLRAVRVHDDHHVRNGRPVPSAHVAAVRRGAGRRMSAPAASPPWRRPRMATVQGFYHSRVRRLRVGHLLRSVHVEVGVDWSAYTMVIILLLELRETYMTY